MLYKVPLDKLYKVLFSCLYEENAEFCPVIVKIIDEYILQQNDNVPYLLQVWTIDGEMAFERPLLRPPANWSISENKLVYVEDVDHTEITLVKLYRKKGPVVFKFHLPQGFARGYVKSSYETTRPESSSANLGMDQFMFEKDEEEIEESWEHRSRN